MQAEKLPTFEPVPNPALTDLGMTGIRLVGPVSPALDRPFIISGRFIVSQEDYDRMGHVPHRHLVLTILRKSMYGSIHPFRNSMIFQDDVKKMGDTYSGWFSLDVWSYSQFRYEGIYYVRVSLGDSLSNVVKTMMPSATGGSGAF